MRPIQLRQERDFGEKINITFQFVTQNFKPLFGMLLYLAIPFSLVSGICNAIFQGNFQKAIREVTQDASSVEDPTDIFSKMFGLMFEMFTSPIALLSIIFSILAGVMVVLVVNGYLIAYEDTDESPITLPTVLEQVKKNIVPVVITTIVCTALTLLGTAFFIIPGIYLGITFTLSSIIVMREGLGISEVISRSFKLIKDKWWSTFGLLIVMGICVAVLGMAVAIPTTIVSLFEAEKIAHGETSILYIAVTALTSAVGALLNAIIYVAIGFQYYNLVEKKDGLGLKQQINSIGQSKPTSTPKEEEGDF